MRKRIRDVLSCMVPLGMALCATAAHAQAFEVTSASYKDGGVISKKQAGTAAECGGGEGLSPQVSWHNLPAGTQSVAVLMFDPDGQKGLGVSHWVAYNIDAQRGSLKEGEGKASAKGVTVGKNIAGEETYRGLCAPAGDNPHHYGVTVIATTLAPDALPAGLSRDELLQKLKGHALGGQSIVGRYGQ